MKQKIMIIISNTTVGEISLSLSLSLSLSVCLSVSLSLSLFLTHLNGTNKNDK